MLRRATVFSPPPHNVYPPPAMLMCAEYSQAHEYKLALRPKAWLERGDRHQLRPSAGGRRRRVLLAGPNGRDIGERAGGLDRCRPGRPAQQPDRTSLKVRSVPAGSQAAHFSVWLYARIAQELGLHSGKASTGDQRSSLPKGTTKGAVVARPVAPRGRRCRAIGHCGFGPPGEHGRGGPLLQRLRGGRRVCLGPPAAATEQYRFRKAGRQPAHGSPAR